MHFDAEFHDVSDFDCGVLELNEWLRNSAEAAERRRTARTWVWTDDRNRVLGYFALAAHVVARAETPSRLGRGGPAEIPAVLVAKLALDSSLRGSGLGGALLADALMRCAVAAESVGARLVVVDALTAEVALWYEQYGFTRVPGSLRLVQRVRDIAALGLGS